jgi:dephospho-CoA kinase
MGPGLDVSTVRTAILSTESADCSEGSRRILTIDSEQAPIRMGNWRQPGSEQSRGNTKTKPYVIGLTGIIGAGKSTVAGMLSSLGAQIIDTDRVVHELLLQGTWTYQAVIEEFGRGILRGDGEVDRIRLAGLVFSDPGALERLEGILHPAVIQEVVRRIDAAEARVLVVEAIKLFESGMHKHCDAVWVVTCHPEQQVIRLGRQRGMSEEKIRLRANAQSPQSQMAAQADVVIDNGGCRSDTRAQVQLAWQSLGCV